MGFFFRGCKILGLFGGSHLDGLGLETKSLYKQSVAKRNGAMHVRMYHRPRRHNTYARLC